MSGLFGMLSSTARSLETQRFGLDVVGQNIANVNTPGYTKRVVDIVELPPSDRLRAGDGAVVSGVRSLRDRLIDRRVREELSQQEREGTVADLLGTVEVALGAVGDSLDASLTEFFDAFARLTETPMSSTARQEVILQGESVARAFNTMAARFESAVADADTRVRGVVEQVNDLTSRIATLNRSLAGTSATSAAGLNLRDQVNHAVTELSELVDLSVIERPDGGFDLALGNGAPLVIGERAYALTVADRAVTGMADIVAGGAVVTGSITGGRLGGLIHVRDTVLPDYEARLDLLAHTVAGEVNALHQAGYGLDGTTAQSFFVPPPGVAGAARALAVDGALTAPGGERLLAASDSATAPGDNGVARSLANLRDAKVMDGGTVTFTGFWGQFVYRVGRDSALARDEAQSQADIVRQIRTLQDAVSGISIDEEASDMLRFQRAYEANARFFTTIDETLETLMMMVR